jgi:hypothetical protein
MPGTFYVIPDIQYNAREEIKNNRKAYRKERGVNEKKADLGYRHPKAFTDIGTHSE